MTEEIDRGARLALLKDAIASKPQAFLVTRVESDGELTVCAFDPETVSRFAEVHFSKEDKSWAREAVADVGAPHGEYTWEAPFVWRAEAEVFRVWSLEEGLVFSTDRVEARWRDRDLLLGQGTKIIGFVGDDLRERGVRLETDGAVHDVATCLSIRAGADWSYGWTDVIADTMWVVYLGSDLGRFLAVPFDDRT